MAGSALSFAREQRPSPDLRRVHCLLVAMHKAVEWGFGGEPGSLEGGERPAHVLPVHRVAKHLLECLDKLRNCGQFRDDIFRVLLSHFHRIENRQRSLLFEGGSPPVPEQGLIKHGVQDGRSVALPDLIAHAARGFGVSGETIAR